MGIMGKHADKSLSKGSQVRTLSRQLDPSLDLTSTLGHVRALRISLEQCREVNVNLAFCLWRIAQLVP